MSWDDPQTETADLVILRAAWDYAERQDEFLAWTTRVRNLLNPPALVAWNSDKHYLQDLAAAGVPTVPSFFLEPGQDPAIPAACGGVEVVVKPAVGAGSIGTSRFVDHGAAAGHAAGILDRGRSVLVQPYDSRVQDGETALVFIGGEQSHAFTKGPILPPEGEDPVMDESGVYANEDLAAADPDFEMWDLGHAALDAACARAGIAKADLLYARVDLIGRADSAVLLELELIEPRRPHPLVAAAAVRPRGGVSLRAPGPRSALASTPIALLCRRCRQPRRRRAARPGRPVHRCGTGRSRSAPVSQPDPPARRVGV
jgi:hypothetical protein